MPIEFFWQAPTSGDGRYGNATVRRRGERSPKDGPPFTSGVSDPRGARFDYFDHLHQIARAAELSRFDGIRIPHDADGDESWIVAGYVARAARRLKVLAEFEASRGSAVYAAKNATSYQRFSGGRFAWQVSPGGDAYARRKAGDFVDAAAVFPRIEELVAVARGVWGGSPFNYKGQFFDVQNGGFQGPLANQPAPEVFLSGDTREAWRLSARVADVHVFDAAPTDRLRAAAGELAELASQEGRSVRVALRIDVVARETDEEATFDAERFRQQSGRLPDASLVGSYASVVERLGEYIDAGVTTFLLAGVPHLEEAYRVGEHVLPTLRANIAAGTRRVA